MISLRSVRNLATLLSVALAVTGLVAAFNYAATAEKHILGTLDNLSPELLIVRYSDETMLLSQVDEDRRELQSTFGDAVMTAPLMISPFVSMDLCAEPISGAIIYTSPELHGMLGMELTPKQQDYNMSGIPANRDSVFLAKGLSPYFGGSHSPVGMSLYLSGRTYFVEGEFICNDKLLGPDWQRVVLASFTSYGRRTPDKSVQLVIHFPGGTPADAKVNVESSLMRMREKKNFSVSQFESMLESKRKITNSIKLLTESISLIVLLMASVSCMNIFFISVNERTREIGLRRALGATRCEIIRLVMLDCYLFMAIGTAVGLSGGYFFTQHLMQPLLLVMPEFVGWQFDAHSEAIQKTLAFLLAGASLSGLFPAIRAAGIDPAVALRE